MHSVSCYHLHSVPQEMSFSRNDCAVGQAARGSCQTLKARAAHKPTGRASLSASDGVEGEHDN